MMDPLSALGVAASVAQFLELGYKVARKLSEYNKASIHDVPKSMQSINTQLPLLLNALNRVKSDVQVDRLDTDTRCILRGVVHGCGKVIAEVDEVMGKVSRQPGESLPAKLKKVLSSLKHDETIQALDKSLQTYIQVLILHHVVDAADVPPPPPEETKYYQVRERFANPYYARPRYIEQLDELFYDAARSQVKVPTVVVLHGEKGVGKSQLAVDYCQQSHALSQFQSVFWLNASTPESLGSSIESIAAVIRRSSEGKSSEKLNFVKTFLEELWHPWLLVLDDYDHKAFGYEPVLSKLPQRGYGAILVTSRQLGASVLGTVIQVQKFLSTEEERQLNYELRSAVENKDWPEVQSIVQQGFEVNQIDHNLNWPFITRAALLGFEEAVDLFLKKGASMDLVPSLVPPLEWACDRGSVSIVNRLLDEEDRIQFRMKPNQYDDCMARAIEACHLPVVKILYTRRTANLDVKDRYRRPTFIKAIEGSNIEMLRYLIQHGAGPKTPELKAEALVRAVTNNNMELLKYLIEEAKFDPNSRTEDKNTALYSAAQLQDSKTPHMSPGMDMVRYLLAHGADPMLDSCGGEIPLHPAALRGHVDKITILLEHGSDIMHNGNGWTPITQAAKYNSPEAFPVLLSWPIEDAEKKAAYRAATLQAAARWNKKELALAVLKAEGGVDINAKDWRGQTSLLLAIEEGSTPIARMLIRNNARQDIPDDKNQYPILAAAKSGLDLVVRDLIKAKDGPGFDFRDDKQNSALHLAVKAKNESTVKVLLEGGADRDDMNAYGETPLDIAEEMKLKEIIEVLNDMEITKK